MIKNSKVKTKLENSTVSRPMQNAVYIKIKNIIPDDDQPRSEFDEQALKELSESIELHGLLQPIGVDKCGKNKYKIISGERRFKACQLLEMLEIPCIISDASDKAKRFAVQLVENLKREDLSPIEKAKALLRLKGMLGKQASWASVETSVNISESRRKQFVRLLELPEEMQSSIVSQSRRTSANQITELHARALLKLNGSPAKQQSLYDEIISERKISGNESALRAELLLSDVDIIKPVTLSIDYTSKEDLINKLEIKLTDLRQGEISRVKSSSDTKIEWTDKTWNPSSGCKKVSPGCANCYAEKEAGHLMRMGKNGYAQGFEFQLKPDQLIVPLNWSSPQLVFVDSMSDLFIDTMPFGYIDRVMEVISHTPRHTYQILTKRPAIMKKYFRTHPIPNNAWLGVSVENKRHGLPRIDLLRGLEPKVKFVSIEPLLEDLGKIDLTGIDWVIVGGESGHKARPMKEEWVINT